MSSGSQFRSEGLVVNLLDTPGHADFSEDTYRVLTAVDSALMVIDCAKGVEERTIKLMDVCRLRDTPIMTFINKLDREGRAPIELLDEVESVLRIQSAPITWPIGMGSRLKGVYHLFTGEVHVFEPAEDNLTGFVFKIQANMDPMHRDRVAFMRICSGEFSAGMKAFHVRSAKEMKLANALTFMASDRDIVERAYPGDVIGIHNHGTISIGDTFSEGEALSFTGIPNFAPELFRRARLRDPLKMKQLQKGLAQLSEEGATQFFRPLMSNDLILGAIGVLQFDVVAYRLKDEYGVDCVFENVGVVTARWVRGGDKKVQ